MGRVEENVIRKIVDKTNIQMYVKIFKSVSGIRALAAYGYNISVVWQIQWKFPSLPFYFFFHSGRYIKCNFQYF